MLEQLEGKACHRCELPKELEDFRINKRRSDGRDNVCKQCTREIGEEKRVEFAKKHKKKRCPQCKQNRLLKFFHKDRTTTDGFRQRCSLCLKEENRIRWMTMPEEQRKAQHARSEAWKKNNPRAYRRILLSRDLTKNFGMTLEEYEKKLEEQKHCCAICGRKETLSSNKKTADRLSVDHDHKTKRCRGLICHHCNRGLGLFRDDPEVLEKAAAYLRKHSR